MKIAFLADALDLQYAGIHIYLREILKAISRQIINKETEHEIFVVRPEAKGDLPGITEIVDPLYSFVPLHQKIRFFTSIPYLMRKHKMDLVVEPCHFGPFNLPASIKRVTVIHDITPVLFPEYHVASSHYFHRMFLPGIVKNANGIIVNSSYTGQDLQKHYPKAEGKIKSILLGKDEQFVRANDPKVLVKYKIDQPYFLFVGTLEPRKNLLTLLAAFEKFKRSSQLPHQLVLVGKEGWKLDAFHEKLSASDFKEDVKLTSYVEREELPVLYSMAEAFVYPSFYEGFGLPVLEAMACGTAVLTSNVSSLPEVAGEAALYFDPLDSDKIAEQLFLIASDLNEKEKLGKAGLARAKQFNWDKAAKETMVYLESILFSTK